MIEWYQNKLPDSFFVMFSADDKGKKVPMPANKLCDFCLSESKGLFNRPEELSDGHFVCRDCKQKIKKYNLPVKYDLFQLLVVADPYMREMIMGNYLEQHNADDTIAKFFPIPEMKLHRGEHCINVCDASITVAAAAIPSEPAEAVIGNIIGSMINDIPDAPEGVESVKVQGKLYETDVALYFMSDHFLNCHRISDMVRSGDDKENVHVIEKKLTFTYAVENADLFFMRDTLYNKIVAAQANKKQNLIYINSENTMTLTPGIYSIPRNIRAGTYYVSALNDLGLNLRDVNGHLHDISSYDRVKLDEGTLLECTGEYQLRIKPRD